jgi:hypothetical protein
MIFSYTCTSWALKVSLCTKIQFSAIYLNVARLAPLRGGPAYIPSCVLMKCSEPSQG